MDEEGWKEWAEGPLESKTGSGAFNKASASSAFLVRRAISALRFADCFTKFSSLALTSSKRMVSSDSSRSRLSTICTACKFC